MSIKLEAPVEKTVTITVTGEDFETLLDISRYDISIPALLERTKAGQGKVSLFLEKLRRAIEPDELGAR